MEPKSEEQVHKRRGESALDLTKRYPGMMIATTLFATLLGGYVMMLYTNWNNEIKKHVLLGKALPQDADVSDRWKQLGRDYDEEVEWSEKFWFLNISGKRKKLAAQAYGKVLEVSAGTGRNLEYYNLHPFDPTNRRQNLISSLTLNDQSPVMIATAEKKYEEFHAQNQRPFTGRVDFVVGDAGIRGIIKRPEGGYDTIVQTMGLCSMVDPVSFLKVMGTLCRQPGEESKTKDMQIEKDDGKGGRILLLEHGRSRYGIVNRILDSGASMHADHYGCWWNKDIARIIQQAGLEIEKVKRYHWGTTWEIHLRPKRKTSDSKVSE